MVWDPCAETDVIGTVDQINGWIRWLLPPNPASDAHIDHFQRVVLFEIVKAILKRRYVEPKQLPKVVEVRLIGMGGCVFLVRPHGFSAPV